MEERLTTESLILGAIYQDLTLSAESNLSANDFCHSKTSFYFALAKELVKNVKTLDELSVFSWVNANGLKDMYEEYGGFKSI